MGEDRVLRAAARVVGKLAQLEQVRLKRQGASAVDPSVEDDVRRVDSVGGEPNTVRHAVGKRRLPVRYLVGDLFHDLRCKTRDVGGSERAAPHNDWIVIGLRDTHADTDRANVERVAGDDEWKMARVGVAALRHRTETGDLSLADGRADFLCSGQQSLDITALQDVIPVE